MGRSSPHPVAIYAVEEELPLSIDTVLYPYPVDEAPHLEVQRLEVDENGERVAPWEASGLCLLVDGRRDYYVVAHERRALRRFGPVVCDGEIALLRCAGDDSPWRLTLVNGSYVELDGRTIVDAEHTFEFLELVWESDALKLHCHPQIGATVWAGDASHLVVDAGEKHPISSIDGQIDIFENWLD